MSRVWSDLARRIEPYVPGEQPKGQEFIKLNTNENPYPPAPQVLEAIRGAADASLRLYPQPESPALAEAIAGRHGLDKNSVFVGNGSDEVLALAFLAYFSADTPLRTLDLTYSFYRVYASLFGMAVDEVPLNADFSLPVERLFHAPGGVIFANPNAPTSMAIPLCDVERVLKANERVVIVDEAYVEFGAESAVALIPKYDNLLVVKTFSKSHALAGLRVGYALGQPQVVEALYRVKNSFNSYPLDRVAQAAAAAAMHSEDYTQASIARIVHTRGEAAARLAELGFSLPQSHANFLFIRHERRSAVSLQADLRQHGILVRHFNSPRIEDRLRVTIGTEAEMTCLLNALNKILCV